MINRVLRRRGVAAVPAPSTITGILRRHGLLDPQPVRRAHIRFERSAANELWQMDFKGWFSCADGVRCHTFGMLDDHSRFNVALRACSDQRATTVKTVLTKTFSRYGLPEAILCDNGPPWGVSANTRWTSLTVWLLDLGISVIHSRPYHPQTAGKQERFHRTVDLEVLTTRPQWNSIKDVQAALNPWRDLYNYERPHQSLGELVVPADRYQPSTRTMPTHIDDPEYPDGYATRIVDGTRIYWKGNRYRISQAFHQRPVGIVPTTTEGTYNVYYRHQHIRTITTTTP